VWEAFLQGIFNVLDWFYSFAGDWGLSIVMITVLFRILIYPITRKQYKSTYKMQKMQPRMAEIKEKYAGDQLRQNEEMQKLYKEANFSPLSGCLPMLLQMPIFMALFGVLRELPKFVEASGHSVAELKLTFFKIIPDLAVSSGDVYLYQGILPALPYALMVVFFGVSMFVPMMLNKNRDRQQMIMTAVMTALMFVFGWGAPAGVLLYWVVSSLIGVCQQVVSKKMMEKKEAEMEEKVVYITPVKVEVERKPKKARPKKSK